ncbi:MAG: flagellar biosynthesis protein FlhF [Desulfobacterales bacterium]|nr:MAG: flagellar biosynthesis protein FlhF [Desulfobacterales bacterium]
MQIKRYEAKNMTTALRMIKGELGPEAVILSARSIRKGKGFFGSMKYAGVEVTAAIDKQRLDSKKEHTADIDTARDISRKSLMDVEYRAGQDKQAPTAAYPASNGKYSNSYLSKNKVEARNNRALSSLYQQMLAQEVDRKLASELIDEIRRIPASEDLISHGTLKSHLVAILEEMGVWTVRNSFAQEKPNITAMIGTSGVGKTTTLAKLAALQTSRYKKRLALISTDNYSIAANEQLKTYARIIGVPLELALDFSELNRAIKKFSHKDLILIDTPGINPSDQNQISELHSYLAKIPNLQTHLVVSATTKENDLIAISEAFKGIGVQRLLFTKIDESSSFGNIINVLIRTGLPLSFLCCGQKVPDDIEAGSVQKLVDLLFKSKDAVRQPSINASDMNVDKTSAVHGRTNKPMYFVANKNSDVYHCTDCKWSARIKAGNIIQFNSRREAESQNFLPCRSCKPDRLHSGEVADGITTRLNLSSYTQRHS